MMLPAQRASVVAPNRWAVADSFVGHQRRLQGLRRSKGTGHLSGASLASIPTKRPLTALKRQVRRTKEPRLSSRTRCPTSGPLLLHRAPGIKMACIEHDLLVAKQGGGEDSDGGKQAPSALSVTVSHLTPKLVHMQRMAFDAGQPPFPELRCCGHRGEGFETPELLISGCEKDERISSIDLKADFSNPYLSSLFQKEVQSKARGCALLVPGKGPGSRGPSTVVAVNTQLTSTEPGGLVQVPIKANKGCLFESSDPMTAENFQMMPEMANESFKVHVPSGRMNVERRKGYRLLGWSNVYGGIPWRVEVTTTAGRVQRSDPFYVSLSTTLVDPERDSRIVQPVANGRVNGRVSKQMKRKRPHVHSSFGEPSTSAAAPLPPLLKKKAAAVVAGHLDCAAQPGPAAESAAPNPSSASGEPTSDVTDVSVDWLSMVVEDVD